MSHRTFSLSCLATALSLGACTESGEPGAAAPTVFNIGLVAQPTELAGEGDLWLVGAREFEAGGHDRNGDGDAFDLVVFVVDLVSGTTRNTGLALSTASAPLPLAVRGRLAAFAASESSGGGRDLNGDGDADDDVVVVHDARDATTRILGLALAAGAQPVVEGELVAFAVGEAAQRGTDLDGDGSANGDVLHVYDGATKTSTNTRLSATSRTFLGGGRVARLVFEALDENGDGDAFDMVLRVFDPATGLDLSSGLASDGGEPLAADGTWLVAVPELAQGAQDLNDDGDAFDRVLHVFDPRDGFVRNLGLVCSAPPCMVASRPASGRASFAILASESGFDLNADGDGLDQVAFTYDPRTDRLTNTGLAAVPPLVFVGTALGFLALEAGQGSELPDADLNGDGDLFDAVAFVTDPFTGTSTNLRQDALDLRGSEDFLLLARAEGTSGVDSNADGDLFDVIVHAFARKTGLTTDTRIASVDAFGASASTLLLFASELGEGRDLNGDRDRADDVFVLFDVPSATARSLNLAGGVDLARFASLARSGRLVLLANEGAQGADLDGDGDVSDQVFHRSR
jgi:hypothetical protein